MTFSQFCEAIFERPLFEWEKKCAEFLEEHPDAKLLHPIARGSSRMSYQERLSILFALYKACGKLSWARREVEAACKHERAEAPEGEWDYGCACYESALKAFESLCKDGHTGFSIGLTKQILNRLIDGKPLCPIEDTEESWNHIADTSGHLGEEANYQCKRMSSLFKYVYADGSVKYRDIDRFILVDTVTDTIWHSGLVDRVLEELYPITMPYIPSNKPYKAMCEEYLTDCKNGDFDTVGILNAIEPDGKTVEINRYFKDVPDGWEEISLEEFKSRRAMHFKRLHSEIHDKKEKEKKHENN